VSTVTEVVTCISWVLRLLLLLYLAPVMRDYWVMRWWGGPVGQECQDESSFMSTWPNDHRSVQVSLLAAIN